MSLDKLKSLRRKLEQLRARGGVKPGEVERLAKALGRVKDSRGKEPTWVSAVLPDRFPVSIPHHGNVELNRFTKNSILDQLEADLEQLEQMYGTHEDEGGLGE